MQVDQSRPSPLRHRICCATPNAGYELRREATSAPWPCWSDLFLRLNVVEQPSPAGVTNNPDNHWPVNHGADDVIDSLANLDDLHELTVNCYLEPVLIQVNRSKYASKGLFR